MTGGGHGRGGTPASRVVLRVAELLKDGQWHDVDWVVAEAGKVIPPGEALRKNEMLRQVPGGAPAERRRPLSEARRIASGRRGRINEIISLKAYYEIDRTIPEKRRVRMVKVPPKVAQAWEAMERNEWFDPEGLADDLQDDPHTSISGLTPAELRRLVSVLVDRLGEREEEQ